MIKNSLYLFLPVVLLFSSCDKTSQDFRLDLIGEYQFHRSCTQESGGMTIWEEESDLTAQISIPLSTEPYNGFNPPNYVKPEDRALRLDLFPENNPKITYYLWVNPDGDIKEAIFDANHIISGKALPGDFMMTICDCGLGSQITCTFD